MTDILDQMRTVSGCTQKTFMHRLDWDNGRRIINEAAAEIERLRAERDAAFEQARRDREYTATQTGESVRLANQVIALSQQVLILEQQRDDARARSSI